MTSLGLLASEVQIWGLDLICMLILLRVAQSTNIFKPYILLVTTQYQKKRQFPFHFRLLRKELFEIYA